MATFTWTGALSDDWSNPGNWDKGAKVATTYPGEAGATTDDATISADTTVVLDVTTAIDKLKIDGGGTLEVGSNSLTAGGGVSVKDGFITLAGGALSSGTANIDLSAGTQISGYGDLTAADYTGAGTLEASGGLLDVTGDIPGGSSVQLVVDTAPSSDLKLEGAVTTTGAVALDNSNQTLEVGASGALTFNTIENVTNATIKLDGGTLTDKSGFTLGAGASLTGSGTVTTGAAGGSEFSGAGTVTASGGTLEFTESVNPAGSTATTFDIDSGATLEFDKGIGGTGLAPTINFETGAETLVLGGTAVGSANIDVTGFKGSDAIDVAAGETLVKSGTDLLIENTDGKVIDTINLGSASAVATAQYDDATGDITVGSTPPGAPTLSVNFGSSPGYEDSPLGPKHNPTTPLFPDATVTTGGGSGGNEHLTSLTLTLSGTTADQTLSLDTTALAAANANDISLTTTYDPHTATIIVTLTYSGGGNGPPDATWDTILQGLQYNDKADNIGGQQTLTVTGATNNDAIYPGGTPGSATFDTFCFMPGTLIRTPEGEVAVERLKRGDLVVTADGRTVPVAWLGVQTISRRFADPLRTLPIRIRAGALGDNVPARDLRLSPDHAVFVDGALIHAGALVNGASIIRETDVPEIFTYYHVETDDHSLIVAENTPAETFVDNVDRMNFDNWAEHQALYPDGKEVEELPYPRAKSQRQVPVNIRVMLAERAIAIGAAMGAVA